jgi:hypothetical protein
MQEWPRKPGEYWRGGVGVDISKSRSDVSAKHIAINITREHTCDKSGEGRPRNKLLIVQAILRRKSVLSGTSWYDFLADSRASNPPAFNTTSRNCIEKKRKMNKSPTVIPPSQPYILYTMNQTTQKKETHDYIDYLRGIASYIPDSPTCLRTNVTVGRH